MKKAVWSGILAAAGMLVLSTPVFAQAPASADATVTVTANVNAKAKLTINSGLAAAISFADADPDVQGTLAANNALSIDVKARTSTNGSVSLTVVAGDDLKSGATDTIAISNLTWAGSGAGFSATGTSSKAAPVTVASFTGSGNRTGTQNYSLANSWSYATGTYNATLTYTLTAP